MRTRYYTEYELIRLHDELYDILSVILMICEKHNISYFAIGGTLIGAMYDHSILPWDDDVDIGMTRENYNRFLEIAPNELGDKYFLSYLNTDANTPFFYAKVKKNDTLFVEEKYQHINMHQGIFVDIFPFDNVPDRKVLRKIHYKLASFMKTCLMGKEVWMWKYFKKCEIDNPLERSLLSTLLCWLMTSLFSKNRLYNILTGIMTLFNRTQTSHVGLVITTVDYFQLSSLSNCQNLKFGPVYIKAASDLDDYLQYNSLHRFTDEELLNHRNHMPLLLKFSE